MAGEGRRNRGVPLTALWQAFDAARFGESRTLNLRESLPTVDQATLRLDRWLRQKQVEGAKEVLVITGRGKGSEGGVSPVREGAIRLFHSLRRGNVVASHTEHTSGSFVVALMPVKALVEAPARRRRGPVRPPVPEPPSLEALDVETRTLLRHLAENALDHLGVRERGPFLEGEMVRQFGVIAAAVPEGPEREARLRDAIRRAIDEY